MWSTISLFESLQLGMIYFIPSLDFIFELSRTGHFWFQPPFRKDLFHLSEWYSLENKDVFVYFNSWEDLKEKINNLDYTEKSNIVKQFAKIHLETYLNKWNSILQ